MARYSEHDTEGIYELAASWKTRCLIEGRSLLWENEHVWTKEALDAFKACFIDRPDESSDNFEEKFKRQLAGENANVTKLAAELILIYFLFPSRVSGARKRALIKEILSWKAIELPSTAEEVMKPLYATFGLAWDAQAIRAEANPANIATASLWQARQPVYTHAAGRWRNFEKHLQPLQNALDRYRAEYP